MTTARAITCADGVTLEGEVARATTAARAAMVLCHPHPLYGGSMRSIVISSLFEALPAAGVSCLRFNFRGVEGSEGTHDEGRSEGLDVSAAIDVLSAEAPSLPLVLTGWSFGADMALASSDERLEAWLAIAPPLRFATDFASAHDPRPKLLALAEHDEYRAPQSVVEAVATWAATETTVIGGASHFFVGRTDRLVQLAVQYVERLVGS